MTFTGFNPNGFARLQVDCRLLYHSLTCWEINVDRCNQNGKYTRKYIACLYKSILNTNTLENEDNCQHTHWF